MKHALQADLLRLLSGELPPDQERALRQRLAREPDLAATFRRLEGAWARLELPPPAPLPLGFSGRVMARVREMPEVRSAGAPGTPGSPRRTPGTLKAGTLSWAAAPTWVRASCAAALVGGVLLGAGLGARGTRGQWQARQASPGVPALTESYWAMVETAGSPATADEAAAAGAPALPSSPRGEDRR
jgi:anti-sigma factor RsiW